MPSYKQPPLHIDKELHFSFSKTSTDEIETLRFDIYFIIYHFPDLPKTHTHLHTHTQTFCSADRFQVESQLFHTHPADLIVLELRLTGCTSGTLKDTHHERT